MDEIGMEYIKIPRVTPPDDRILKETDVIYTMYRPNGYFLIYSNNSVEFKVPSHHITCNMDYFMEILQYASDLDTAIMSISNIDECDREKLIEHLNYEAQYWEAATND